MEKISNKFFNTKESKFPYLLEKFPSPGAWSLAFMLVLFVMFFGYNSNAQLKWLAKATKVGKHGNILDKLDKIGDIARKAPVSKAGRQTNGISVFEAGFSVLALLPEDANKFRFFLGTDEVGEIAWLPQKHEYLDDMASELSFQDHLNLLYDRNPSLEIEYVLEKEVIDLPNIQAVLKDPSYSGNFFLANYEGKAWPIRNLDGLDEIVAEVYPSLFIRTREISIENFTELAALEFHHEDIKVVSLFDEVADDETMEAIKVATADHSNYQNILTKQKLFEAIEEKRGQIVAIIGHVDDHDLVVEDISGVEKLRISLHEVNNIAEKSEASVIYLGCETAKKSGRSGLFHEVNSIETANQLKKSLASATYGDFFASFATNESPFVIFDDVIQSAQILVAKRIDETGRIKEATKYTFNTIRVSPKLVKSSQSVGANIFPSLPSWFNSLIFWALFLMFIAIGISFVISFLSLSLKPIQKTVLVIFYIVISPVTLLTFFYKRISQK